MKVEFGKVFERDILKLNQGDRRRVAGIVQLVINATSLRSIPNVKKLKATDNAYRIRLGEHRVGFFLEGGVVTFMRCLSRKEIYRQFP